jgi:ABC-type branched-subunit amino acid transport system substrate-binding protein
MKNIYKIIGSILILILVVVVMAMFINDDKQSKELNFGLITGLSGDYAVVGESFVKGVTLAQEEWNIKNPNQQIKVITENDEFDAKKGLSAYNKLININHVDGLINMTTLTMDVIYSDVVKTGLPVAQGFEQGIDAKNDNIIQLWPGNVPAEAKLGEYVKNQGYKNVAVFVDNSSSFFTQALNGFKKGYDLPLTEYKVSSDVATLRSSALKMVENNPDAVFFLVQPDKGAILLKELIKVSKIKYQFVFDANLQTGFETYTKLLGDANILNGSIVFVVPNVYRQEFMDAFKKRFNEEPAIGAETGYNAFVLLTKSYNTDKAVWIKNMQKASFIGADGAIKFDENGVRIPELKIGVVENGKLPN